MTFGDPGIFPFWSMHVVRNKPLHRCCSVRKFLFPLLREFFYLIDHIFPRILSHSNPMSFTTELITIKQIVLFFSQETGKQRHSNSK